MFVTLISVVIFLVDEKKYLISKQVYTSQSQWAKSLKKQSGGVRFY